MPHRLLLIEDEESTRVAMSEYFAARGCSVDCAGNFEEAHRRLDRESYTAVVVDLRLPGPAGHTEAHGLAIIERARRGHLATRVVVLTGSGPELEREALLRGADIYLEKPQPLSHLAEIIGLDG